MQSQCKEVFETTLAPVMEHRLTLSVTEAGCDTLKWGLTGACGAVRRMGTEVAAGWITLHLAY